MKLFADRKIRALFYKILFFAAAFSGISAGGIVYFGKRDVPEYAAYFVLACSLCMILTIIVKLLVYFREQNRIIEEAAAQVREYMAGSQESRIACYEEGELYRLFHEVNSLAAILNAHTEKERKARVFLKDTISDISHQLKTPLAALNIYNGILQDEAQDAPAIQEFTALSEQELDRIETLVQNLLKITKLDAGTIVMECHPENVADMMEDVRKHFAFRAEREGKEIRLSGGRESTLLCDRTWMLEAVGNIVKNALDHTKAGGLIQIEWKEQASVLRLTVRDNGSGVHTEDLYHIFKRFYRSRFSKDTQGIGLGLPLAKSVIEAHNGTIEVDSMEGAGTTFVLNFMLESAGSDSMSVCKPTKL